MKKGFLIGFTLLFLSALLMTSCGGTRKCNGKRGIKTPMGVM